MAVVECHILCFLHSKRFDYVTLARRLTGVGTEEDNGGSEEEQMEVEGKARRPGKRYKDQVC